MTPTRMIPDGTGPGSSRAATERLLGNLRDDGLTPRAWLSFLEAATLRSIEQARSHPAAFVELSALHLLFTVGSSARGRLWVAISWLLTAGHLGLLEERHTLGWANVITVTRANLPAYGARLGAWIPVLSVLSDVADGALARRSQTTTPFGRHADFLSDTAVWTWFTLHHEPSRFARTATLASWALPVVVVAGASIARGAMIDVERSRWWRPCAAVQAVVCLRALTRHFRR